LFTGVGKVTTLFLICFTNEFTMFITPRQLAYYAGAVPFEHTSGKSVRSKPKVSQKFFVVKCIDFKRKAICKTGIYLLEFTLDLVSHIANANFFLKR